MELLYESDFFEIIKNKYNVEEIWLPVKRLMRFDQGYKFKNFHYFDRNYYISNLGRLKEDDRIFNHKHEKKEGNPYDLKSILSDVNNVKKSYRRHQIVCQTFLIDTYSNGLSPDHINRINRWDNSVFNLRWADRSVQSINKGQVIRQKTKGVKILCLENKKLYNTCLEAGNDLGLRDHNVNNVARGLYKSSKGYHFIYVTE